MRVSPRPTAVLSTAALVAGALGAAAVPVQALPSHRVPAAEPKIDLNCEATMLVTFKPRLHPSGKNTPTTFEALGKFGPCTPKDGSHAQGGHFKANGEGKISCLGGKSSGTGTVKWESGETSEFTFQIARAFAGKAEVGADYEVAVGAVGRVTSGPYQGKTFAAGMKVNEAKKKCEAHGPGIKKEFGKGVLKI
ncbi:hypothetical protein GCM10010329_62960 [Streptomyces spiroverticillatus]|nr:hypothetical protein GCM10010329_62960 [Streptomyces spiroverticillatus]